MNFVELKDLPSYDLYNEFKTLLEQNKVQWFTALNGNVIKDQVCINTTQHFKDDIFYGRGSLTYDWDNFYFDKDNIMQAPKRKIPVKEEDFRFICSQFKGTLFEEAYNVLSKKYVLGRVRIMNTKPKTCLTWHTDDTPRVHYPIKTQPGCIMVIEDNAVHLEQNKWYFTNTLLPHTAFNGSREERIHLVAAILDTK